MQVFKFGGASVKNADGVRNLARIIQQQAGGNRLLIVVSAMGKTTNALEELTQAYIKGQQATIEALWQGIRTYHEEIIQDLTNDPSRAFKDVYKTFADIETYLQSEPEAQADKVYDQIVSSGEILSTQIVNAYLNLTGLDAYWLDARRLIRTDATYREGRVDWNTTCEYINNLLNDLLTFRVAVTQGFIGSTSEGFTTTLGREGSDYTAAIFAYCLGAEAVTIWKDVPGVLNADPKWFDETVKLDRLTYQDAIELAYYGATVIHPKTIKPLQNKTIPLYVRSFLQPGEAGTVIGDFDQHLAIPTFIFKVNQLLLSLHPKDFSFIAEDNLSKIFRLFADFGLKINLMQNTAISFSVAVDNQPSKLAQLIPLLKEDFRVVYNEGLELITIRYYDQATIDRVLTNKQLLLEQKSRYTVQLVVKDLGGQSSY